MIQLALSIETEIWITATWDEYLQAIDRIGQNFSHSYYHQGQYLIEMTPLGHDHASDNTMIAFAVSLYGTIKNIPLQGLTNCSYRQIGQKECQPDISYYVGDRSQIIPYGTKIINLDRYPAPDLVIEIASTSLADDTGSKRLLYEDLGVGEYWIVDVKNANIIAFSMLELGSVRIDRSQVLPGLEISVLVEALTRSRSANQSQIGQWLMSKFQQVESVNS
jgi:Uma2 family endonuclease